MELLSDPKVIFLDEPTSGLSPDLDLEMMELLKELAAKGRTIVIVTHAMENLDKCDKVIFLGRGGRLCYFGEASGAFRWFNRRSYSTRPRAKRSQKNIAPANIIKNCTPILRKNTAKAASRPPKRRKSGCGARRGNCRPRICRRASER